MAPPAPPVDPPMAGGMAVDCVLNGANMYVARLKSWTVQFIENELCDWILVQGGWVCNLGS